MNMINVLDISIETSFAVDLYTLNFTMSICLCKFVI